MLFGLPGLAVPEYNAQLDLGAFCFAGGKGWQDGKEGSKG